MVRIFVRNPFRPESLLGRDAILSGQAMSQYKEHFDGIICIGGEDWWYHNRGHFDFQIMRRLAQSMPVLFVNSIAVRMPSLKEKGLFAERISRKLKSLARGVVNVENNFWVFSPASIPGATGQKLSGWALAPQIKHAARRAGITRPLLWVHCPAGASLVKEIDAAAVVLQRTDRFEAFPEADPAIVGAQIAYLKTHADLVIYCNKHMMTEEEAQTRRQLLVTHGVDLETFIAAGDAIHSTPVDMQHMRRPRIGFIGGIDAHTFDPELFLTIARQLEGMNFVMIGGSSLPEDWCTLPNVTFLGRKPYDEVASYMAAMDVLIMPWNQSDWIKACNPIKLKEYLAVGRPVVTTDFPALEGFRDLVFTASSAEDFADKIRIALVSDRKIEAARRRIATESWDAKAALVMENLQEIARKKQGSSEARRGAAIA
jgi:glycosyltransferase involved in cell wall biosynthesis